MGKREISPVVAIIAVVVVVAIAVFFYVRGSGSAGKNVSPEEQIRMMQQNTKTPMTGGMTGNQ